MKNTTILLFLSLVFSLSAKAATPALNKCVSLPSTKKYISKNFSSYPRKVIFECTYLCNAENKIHSVNAITSIVIKDFDDDARKTVCQGVVVKKTSFGYDLDRVVSFYAPETNLRDIKKWAFDNINFNPKNNALEKAKLSQLKKIVLQAGASYITAGMSGHEATKYFLEAGIMLSKIAEGLPMNPKKLDEAIDRVSRPRPTQSNRATDLVDSFIRTNASWRIPPTN